MTAGKPAAVQVAVDMFTSAGACRGTLQLPPATAILDFLNRAGEHLRLGEAHVEGDPQGVPFLAVRRDDVRLVLPRDAQGQELAVSARGAEGRVVELAGLMNGCRFQGKVQLAPGQRLTDFFAAAPSFVAVRDCTAWLARRDEPLRAGVALVRAHAVVAFSDTLDREG